MAKETIQISPRVLANRRNARLGGLARAKNNSKEKIKEWASRGGKNTQDLYGSDLGRYAQTLRKTVGCKKKPVEETKLCQSLAKTKKKAA